MLGVSEVEEEWNYYWMDAVMVAERKGIKRGGDGERLLWGPGPAFIVRSTEREKENKGI